MQLNYMMIFFSLFFPPNVTDDEALHISNVTASSVKLSWSNSDPKLFVYFEVTVTRLRDHALVLKTNVSGSELSVESLESSQTYHVVVTARTAQGHIVSIRKGIMTTSESRPPKSFKHLFISSH